MDVKKMEAAKKLRLLNTNSSGYWVELFSILHPVKDAIFHSSQPECHCKVMLHLGLQMNAGLHEMYKLCVRETIMRHINCHRNGPSILERRGMQSLIYDFRRYHLCTDELGLTLMRSALKKGDFALMIALVKYDFSSAALYESDMECHNAQMMIADFW